MLTAGEECHVLHVTCMLMRNGLKLPGKEDGEEDMLDMAFEPKKNSRLSCQLIVSDKLDGLVLNIPSKQG